MKILCSNLLPAVLLIFFSPIALAKESAVHLPNSIDQNSTLSLVTKFEIYLPSGNPI